jgi:hypothetical protein
MYYYYYLYLYCWDYYSAYVCLFICSSRPRMSEEHFIGPSMSVCLSCFSQDAGDLHDRNCCTTMGSLGFHCRNALLHSSYPGRQ